MLQASKRKRLKGVAESSSSASSSYQRNRNGAHPFLHTGKIIFGKLSEFIGVCPINSDKFIGSDKLPGSGLQLNSDKFIGIYRS